MAGFLCRLAILLMALLAAGVAVIGAIVFFCFALYAFFGTLMNAAGASLASAATLIVLAILFLMLGSLLARRRGTPRKDAPDTGRGAADLGEILGRQIRGFAGEHGKGAIIGSLLAGVVIGASPKLRSFLLRIVLKS